MSSDCAMDWSIYVKSLVQYISASNDETEIKIGIVIVEFCFEFSGIKYFFKWML